jgi:myosin-crossreactive antigen
MRKKYILYQNITEAEIKQLKAADIDFEYEEEVETIEVGLAGSNYSAPTQIKKRKIYLYVSNERQETLLALLFPQGSYGLDYGYYKEFSFGP